MQIELTPPTISAESSIERTVLRTAMFYTIDEHISGRTIEADGVSIDDDENLQGMTTDQTEKIH